MGFDTLSAGFGVLIVSVPSPSGISLSGTVGHGNTVTLNVSSGFGVKDGDYSDKPLIWAPFENPPSFDPSALGGITSWQHVHPTWEFSSVTSPTNKTSVPRIYVDDSANDDGMDFAIFTANGFDTFYMFAKRNFNYPITSGGVNDRNLKHHRWYNAADISGYPIYNNMYACMRGAGQGSGVFPEQTSQYSSIDDAGYNYIDPVIPSEQWVREEVELKLSTLDGTDGEFRNWWGNTEECNISDMRHRTTAIPGQYNLYYLQHYINQISRTDDTTMYCYLTDVYIDNSWCRVVAGNASTWAACTEKEIQIPSAWADTAISITCNRGAWTSLTGKYLYVVLADGSLFSTDGYLLS